MKIQKVLKTFKYVYNFIIDLGRTCLRFTILGNICKWTKDSIAGKALTSLVYTGPGFNAQNPYEPSKRKY